MSSTRNFDNWCLKEQAEIAMDANIKAATDQTRQEFWQSIDDRLGSLEVPCRVEKYKAIEISDGIKCEEPLDIVRSIPEFTGDMTKYVSWR